MGRYVNWEQVSKRYGAMMKNRGSDTADEFIGSAEDEIDARLGSIYSVPFTPVPGVIAMLAKDLAWAQMNISNKETSGPIFARVNSLIAQLLSRDMILQASGTLFTPASIVTLSSSGTASSFGVDDTTRFRVDSNWQQSFESARGDAPL